MNKFDLIVRNLLKNPFQKTILKIRNHKKKIKGMARFETVQNRGSEYIKIIFRDDSFLLILLNEKELYYADKLAEHIKEIKNSDIGKKKILKYKGKKYKLETTDDYQFCLQLYVGKAHSDIEGECKFSDYFPISDLKEFLSLGWLSYNKKRADIHCKLLELNEIEIT